MTLDIINQLISQYTGSISNLETGSIALGKDLFNSVAVISIAILGFNHLLRRNVDLVDQNIELIRWLIYLDFFYCFITNFPQIYSFVYSSSLQIADYLGTKAAGKAVDISAANILHIGVKLSLNILSSNLQLNLFRNFLYPLVSVICAVVILFCFTSIGLELILVQIGSQIILTGGIFLLAFSAFQWTRDYAERYVHTFFHTGIKMVFIYIMVGLGIGLADSWTQTALGLSWSKVLDYDIAVGLSSYIYYKLCLKVPDQAVTWLTGRFAMGFETFTDVKAGSKAALAVPSAAMGAVHAATGMVQAVGTASLITKTALESQGKKIDPWKVTGQTLKTLGAAWKSETWDKKVAATLGGKMNKVMLDAQKASDGKSKEGTTTDNSHSTDDSTDFSI